MSREKKRVLFIRSNPVDPDTRVEKEVDTLIHGGYEVDVLAWDRTSEHPIKKEYLKTSPLVSVYRVGIVSQYAAGFKKNLLPLARFQLAIVYFIIKNHKKYDIIHACDFDTAFTASKISALYNIKLVYDIFDYYVDSFSVPQSLRNAIETLDHKIINNADGVIICTEQRKQQLGNVNPRRLTVIHNSPDFTESYTKNNNEQKKDVVKIAYVGILSYGRNIEMLCEFVSQNPSFELHIGGFGILEDMVKKYSGEFGNIVYYGKVPYAKTISIESKCDIITAIYDPTVKNHVYAAPNKFYEGLLLGKPLIMASGTGMSDVVQRERIGVVCDFNNIGEGLIELEKMRDEWYDIGVREKLLYKEYYSWTEMKRRLLELYNAI